jgi:DNA repair protein RecO (recombination protein O)
MPDKPAPALFVLYKSYHKQVVSFNDPAPLLASFSLKLLKHEGLLTLTSYCSSCDTSPAHLLYNGESLCAKHNTQNAMHFSIEEWKALLSLDQAQQFSTLRQLSIPPALSQKINNLFLSRLSF